MASVSLGGGKESSESSTSSPAADALATLATTFAKETTGLRQDLISQLTDALQTGETKTSKSITTQAVQSSLKAASDTRAETQAENARTGLSGTPFGTSLLSSVMQQGVTAAKGAEATMKNQVYNQALQSALNFVLGQSQTATGGLAGAIPGTNSTSSSGKSLAAGK